MGLDTILFIIFIVVVLFGGAVKKLLDRLQEQVAAQGRDRVDYEASPEQVMEFLEGLRTEQQPQVGGQEAPVGEGLREARARPELPRPIVASPQLERQAPSPLPLPRVAPRKRPRRRAEAPSAAGARRKKEPALPPQAQKAAAVTPLALRGTDLRQAVIWSEILGPPVSVRRSRLRPPRETP